MPSRQYGVAPPEPPKYNIENAAEKGFRVFSPPRPPKYNIRDPAQRRESYPARNFFQGGGGAPRPKSALPSYHSNERLA